MTFIDTNYFLRFFTGQPADQYELAKSLFHKGATGETTLITSVVVFFEIYWVATSFYGFDKEKTTELLRNVLKMEFIRLENRDVLTGAVTRYESSTFDLEDAYNLVYARQSGVRDFASFDQKLKKRFGTIAS